MLTRRDWMITAAGATAALSTAGEARSDDDEPDSADDGRPNGLFFEAEELVGRLPDGGRWVEFLDEPSMMMGIYRLPAGSVDGQNPHDLDEVYYVLEGKGQFTVSGETKPVEAGGVLFVRAKAEHRFHDIEEDLVLLVFFSKGKTA